MRIHVLSDLWLDCDNRLAESHWRLHDRANAIESWFALRDTGDHECTTVSAMRVPSETLDHVKVTPSTGPHWARREFVINPDAAAIDHRRFDGQAVAGTRGFRHRASAHESHSEGRGVALVALAVRTWLSSQLVAGLTQNDLRQTRTSSHRVAP